MCSLFALISPAAASQAQTDAQHLKRLSIDELIQIDVTIVEARHGGSTNGVAWRPYDNAADRDGQVLSTGGDFGDLLHDHHREFGVAVPRRVEFERGVRVGTAFRV